MRGEGKDVALRRAFWDRQERKVGREAVQIVDVAGNCTSPVIVRYDGHVDREYHARCRRCPGCLRARQWLWKLRAEAEFLVAPQTVFFTGTFRDQHHELEPVREETTRFLYRLRSYSRERGHNFRYLLVPEKHKSGAWHYHGLFHVEHDFDPEWVRYAWQAGWSWPKPANIGSADYVTKYVAKDLIEDQGERVPRIRASRNPTYGGWVVNRSEEEVKKLLEERGEEWVVETWTKNLKHWIREEERNQMNQRNSRKRLIAMVAEKTNQAQSLKSRLES